MKKPANFPSLKFSEFPEDWEKEKLGEMTVWKSGGTPSKKRDDFWGGDIPWISASSMRKIELSESELHVTELGAKNGAKVAKVGSILILVRGSMLFNKIPVGYVTKKLTFNQDVKSVETNKNLHTMFLLYWFFHKENQLKNLVVGTGIGAGKLDMTDLLKLNLHYPSLPEQQKIASFLSSVDERIELMERKKEKLEAYKKGVMQQIFSQQIRFKQDDGSAFPDWEEKRLEDVVNQFLVPMRDKPKSLDGSIPWCRIEDFDGKYLSTSKTNQGVSQSTVKEMRLKVFPVNTLIVSCSAYLGRCAIVKKELVTNQTFIGLVPNKAKVDVEFLYYIMSLSEQRLNTLSSGTTISYLSREQFEKFPVILPELAEQKKIAAFLNSIDENLEALNNQIQGLRTWKKGLLQQMFV